MVRDGYFYGIGSALATALIIWLIGMASRRAVCHPRAAPWSFLPLVLS